MTPLAPIDVGPRADRVRAAAEEAGCDALLVTAMVNIRWLTGFTGSAARVLLAPDRLVLVTDGRYAEQAAAQLAAAGCAAEVVEGRSQDAQRRHLAALCSPYARLGLEADAVSWAAQRSYAEWFPGADLVATTGIVERLRRRKDAAEVERIERAAGFADAALADVAARFLDGPTEADLRDELDAAMRRHGADAPSFDTIIASGPNAARPHHRPGTRKIAPGDFVICDFGAAVDGYCSDMTRTFVVGEPTAEQAAWWDLVAEAQAAGVATVGPGVAASAVDAACRRHVEAAGRGQEFSHGTGHGVGLLIHEAPWLNAASDDVLAPGDVVTVEPGVYRSPLGGVRLEDTLLVTDDGCRPLTSTPKDPACLRSPRTT